MKATVNFKRGASVAGSAGLSYRLQAYGRSHAQCFFSSLGRLVAAPFSTSTAVLAIAVALALPAVFYVLVDNVRLVSSRLLDTNRISLFLKPEITDAKAAVVAEGLLGIAEIESVQLIDRDQALAEFKQVSGFSAALELLDSNPLPAVIQVNPRLNLGPDQLQKLGLDLEALAEADFAQFDLQWIRRLHGIVDLVQQGVGIIGLLLGTGVVFVVSNTVRLELRTRQDEIVVSRLLGATDAFIRRPFLYSGFWYGFGGGLVAAVLVISVLLYFEGPIRHLAFLYESDHRLLYPGSLQIMALLSISSLLGIAGAWSVLLHQLRGIDPGS